MTLDDVCEIFDCRLSKSPKQSLYRWVKRYEELEEIKRLIINKQSYTSKYNRLILEKLCKTKVYTLWFIYFVN